jgi:hypothetical protein
VGSNPTHSQKINTMSRSYKYPILKKNDKYFKKLSNKRIRKYLNKLDLGFKSSNFFKLIENQWNICDFKYRANKDNINKIRRK